jgi:hypothetical protein
MTCAGVDQLGVGRGVTDRGGKWSKSQRCQPPLSTLTQYPGSGAFWMGLKEAGQCSSELIQINGLT